MDDIEIGPFLIWVLRGDYGIEWGDTSIGFIWAVRSLDWRTGFWSGPRFTRHYFHFPISAGLGPLKARIMFMTKVDTLGAGCR